MFLSDVVLIILFCSEGHGGRKISVRVGREKCRFSRGGGGGGGGGGREGKQSFKWICPFCFFYSCFGTDVCQKWLLHRNTFLLDYTLCCLFCGLSQVVGPPGTGKTDVAVQIISNLYHNFPEQRTLLVTHSNQVSSSN